VDQFETIVHLLKEPYRTMVYFAQCLGLRVSEIAALRWDDFDFDKNQLLVQRSFVDGRTDDVKTEYSQDYVPLHPSLSEIVLGWSKEALPTEEGWVFANPITKQPYFPTSIQKRHIRPAGCCLVECPKCGVGVGVWCKQDRPTPNGKRLQVHEERQEAAGRLANLGWHTFRHTYRSWLDETGAPMKVQQELMRHASIQTTMNVYGQAMTSSKRQANSKVVEMVLKPMRASA
jgi:integrase